MLNNRNSTVNKKSFSNRTAQIPSEFCSGFWDGPRRSRSSPLVLGRVRTIVFLLVCSLLCRVWGGRLLSSRFRKGRSQRLLSHTIYEWWRTCSKQLWLSGDPFRPEADSEMLIYPHLFHLLYKKCTTFLLHCFNIRMCGIV